MKHIVRKPYWNYIKEEHWLNDMAAKGLALTEYSWCRYVFEDATPGKYIYRIELLDHHATHPESKKYFAFLEELGIECVATYMRWAYLRKKTSDGPFDLYTDIDSNITHYKKVSALWLTLAGIELCSVPLNIILGITATPPRLLNLVLGGILLVLSLVFFGIGLPVLLQMRRLQKERAIRET